MLNGKHILIENIAGIGDLIMMTPTLRRLKELYPDCVLSILTSEANQAVLLRLPYVDHVYCIRRKRFLGRYRAFWQFFQQDYAIFTSWQPHLAWMAWLTHIPHRVGVCKKKYEGTGLFQSEIRRWVLSAPMFAADTMGEVLGEALGVALDIDDTQCDVSRPNQQERQRMADWLLHSGMPPKQKYAIIVPFSGRSARDIPQFLLEGLETYIQEACGYACVLVGLGSHADRVRMRSGVYSALGKTSLMEMVALMEKAEFIVTPDSGPMHVACAIGKETIGIFSKDIPERWAPKRHCYAVSLHAPCSPCDDGQADRCQKRYCMDDISLDMLIKGIEQLARK